LNEVGIYSENDLKRIGAVGARSLISEKYPNEILAVCSYLYSFEGALTNKHWIEIGEQRKQQLRAHFS